MQLLTALFDFVVIAFVFVAAFDFASGLWKLWLAADCVNTVNKCAQPELMTPAPTPQQEPVQQLETPEPSSDDDPWLTAGIATPSCCCTAVTITAPRPLLLLPPARIGLEQPELDLTALKLYKLHGYSVVRVADLPIEIPVTIKRYKLHKRDVVRLIDLEQFLAAL